jgi:tRNA threonylcarbamoyladenosine biosynthesis protein TsaE
LPEPLPAAVSTERTTGPAETERIGARIAGRLRPGDVVLLSGELGSGKTTLIRGACRALGVTEPVTSPTFTIGHRYGGSVPVAHLDLFRLSNLEIEEPGLLDEYLTPDAVVFVEWPGGGASPLGALGSDDLRVAFEVELEHAGGDERLIRVEEAPQ